MRDYDNYLKVRVAGRNGTSRALLHGPIDRGGRQGGRHPRRLLRPVGACQKLFGQFVRAIDRHVRDFWTRVAVDEATRPEFRLLVAGFPLSKYHRRASCSLERAAIIVFCAERP